MRVTVNCNWDCCSQSMAAVVGSGVGGVMSCHTNVSIMALTPRVWRASLWRAVLLTLWRAVLTNQKTSYIARRAGNMADLTDEEAAKLIKLFRAHENLYNFTIANKSDREKSMLSVATTMNKGWDCKHSFSSLFFRLTCLSSCWTSLLEWNASVVHIGI